MAMNSPNATRRAVVAGLAVSTVAVAPGMAATVAHDPVFAALSNVAAARAERERVGDAYRAALDAFEAVENETPHSVKVEGTLFEKVTLRTHEEIDAYFDKRSAALWNSILGDDVGPAAAEAWETLRATTHRRLRVAVERWREARARFNLDALEEADDDAYNAWHKAERDALATAPTTLAGAKALLEYVRLCMSEDVDADRLFPALENVENLVERLANV